MQYAGFEPPILECEDCGDPAEPKKAHDRDDDRPLCGACKLTPLNRVPVEPLQDAFERQQRRGEVTAGEVARRLGWLRHDQREGAPDTSRVLRALGLKVQQTGVKRNGETYSSARRFVGYDIAVRLAEALGLDPVDVGV